MTREMHADNKRAEKKPTKLSDGELATASGGYGDGTYSRGNTSIWGKIKSIWFGVDPSFYA